VGVVLVGSLAWALPAQAQGPVSGAGSVCAEGICQGVPSGLLGTPDPGRLPYDLFEMTVGQTLPVQCAGQTETVYRVSDDVWVSTCPPERTDYGGGGKYVSVENVTPIVRANAGGESWTVVYSRKETPAPPCGREFGSFVGLEHGSQSNPPKTGVWAAYTQYYPGPFCGPY